MFGGGGQLDGQLEGDVHLSFFSQRDNFRKLYDLEADERQSDESQSDELFSP